MYEALYKKTEFLQEHQFWLGRLSNEAVLMLVYHVILCKFILCSKS